MPEDLELLDETSLVLLAEWDDDDNVANKAMKILREKYDLTYDWDWDMDGLVNTHGERDEIEFGKYEGEKLEF